MNDLTMIRGDTNELTLTLLDSAGQPYDLTGASLSFTVGNLFDKSIGAGITVSAPLTGVATISVDPDDTESSSDIRVSYRYDVQVTFADGSVKTPIRGLFIVLPDVTTPE